MTETKVLSLNEAIAAGYIWAVEDGEEQGFKLANITPDELEEYKKRQPDTAFLLCDIEPKHFSTEGDELRELLVEVADNQDEFGDEDGELGQLVDDLYHEQPDLFQALADALNQKWKTQAFYMPSNYQIDFTL